MKMRSIPNVNVPEGSSGDWKVERYEVDAKEAELSSIRAVFGRERPVPAGTYTRLMCGGSLVMSDTPSEKRDHSVIVWRAEGHVLVTGLGLGMIACALAAKPKVERVTVIERSEDVIRLVGETLPGKVRLIQGDAFTWRPWKDDRFDWAWHDIWTYKCGDNLPEMARLRRRFARSMTESKRQFCWAEPDIRRWER